MNQISSLGLTENFAFSSLKSVLLSAELSDGSCARLTYLGAVGSAELLWEAESTCRGALPDGGSPWSLTAGLHAMGCDSHRITGC